MKTRIYAFSLIELMVVIAIVAVLSAVAVPAYKSFVIRAKISEGMSVVNMIQTKVVERYNRTGSWSSAAQIGVTGTPSQYSPYIKAISIVDYSTFQDVSITWDGALLGIPNLASDNLRFTWWGNDTNGVISWGCGTGVGHGGLEQESYEKYKPAPDCWAQPL